jgi:hypothetical protein
MRACCACHSFRSAPLSSSSCLSRSLSGRKSVDTAGSLPNLLNLQHSRRRVGAGGGC